MFNIADFIATLNEGNFAKTALFDVIVTPPRTMSTDMGELYDLTYRCEATDLPGRNVLTYDSIIYGLPTKIAYGSSVNDVTLSFILSEDYREKIFFETWIDKITGNYRTGEVSQNMFEIGYYKEYIGGLLIRNYSETGEVVKETELVEAYPINIGNVSLNWQNGAEIAKLPVTFAYRYYVDKE